MKRYKVYREIFKVFSADEVLLIFNTLKVESKKLINENVMKWAFSHWSVTGPRPVVLV